MMVRVLWELCVEGAAPLAVVLVLFGPCGRGAFAPLAPRIGSGGRSPLRWGLPTGPFQGVWLGPGSWARQPVRDCAPSPRRRERIRPLALKVGQIPHALAEPLHSLGAKLRQPNLHPSTRAGPRKTTRNYT